MDHPVLRFYEWFLVRTPIQRSMVVFLVGTTVFTLGWLVFGYRSVESTVIRGLAFGLAFAIGYYLADRK